MVKLSGIIDKILYQPTLSELKSVMIEFEMADLNVQQMASG